MDKEYKMYKKTKKHAIVMSCISIAMCIVTLFSFSFSWIKRDWSPVIEQEGITITATSALSLIIDGKATSAIKLVDALKVTDINLQQVSNATGKSNDFFYLESDGKLENAIIKHIDRSDSDGNDFSQRYGYVEFKFMISGKSEGGENVYQKIYLKGDTYTVDEDGKVIKDEGSYLRAPAFSVDATAAEAAVRAAIEENQKYDAGGTEVTSEMLENATPENYVEWVKAAYDARYEKLLNSIRISITTEGIDASGNENTGIYGTIGLIGGNHDKDFTHSGLNPKTTTDENGNITYFIENQNLFDTTTGEVNGDYVVNYDAVKQDEDKTFRNFNDFVNGNKTTIGNETYNSESKTTILTIEPNTVHYMTIRVWLEGTDPGCTEDIAGLKFDLHLRFDSEIITSTNGNS